jgi:hypothetical protein
MVLSGIRLPPGPGHVDLLQLLGVQPVLALDLRDHLVAAPRDVEPVDVVAAHGRGQVVADLLQVEPERRDLVAVEHDLGLRGVILHVDERREIEPLRGHRGVRELPREGEDLLRVGRRREDDLDREVPPPGSEGGWTSCSWIPGIAETLGCRLARMALDRPLALAPGLGDKARDRLVGSRDLEDEVGVRVREERLLDRRGVGEVLVEGRVRRGRPDPEDDALVLGGRQLLRREAGRDHEDAEDADQDPDVYTAPRFARREVEELRVAAPHLLEGVGHDLGEALLVVARPQQVGAHHRRQRQGDEARDHDRPGERERELAEQGAGEAALQADRGVHRRQRDRHRDDRPDSSRAPMRAALSGVSPSARCRSTFSTTTIASSTTSPPRARWPAGSAG